MKMWAVYNTDGERLLSTENIMKARGFASVRNLKVESDKGDTKSSVVNIDIKNLIAEKNIMEKIDEQKKAIEKTKEEISEVNEKEAILDQQKKDQEILSKAGIGQTKAFYDEGSQLNELGVQNLAQSKREWASLPDFDDAIDHIITKVQNEKREARIIPRRKLYFDEKGNIKFLGESESYCIEDTKTFLSKMGLFPSFDAMYQMSSPKYRSEFLNAHIHHMTKVNEEFMNKPIQFGIRETNTVQRSVFRTVSQTYTALESSDALKAFRTISNGNPQAKMLGGYNQHDTSYNVTCLFHANHKTIGAGSVFKFGAKLRGSDRGNGAHRFNLVAWRNLCLNLIMIAEEQGKLTRVIHRGDFQKQVDKMDQAIAEGKPVFDEFLSHWGYATQTKLSSIELYGQKFESVEDATEWLVYNGKINIKQKNDIVVENLLNGYMFEEGDTLSHLINMLTRTAHVSYKGKNKEFLEEFSGKLTRELAYA